jgi:hypothetical protein
MSDNGPDARIQRPQPLRGVINAAVAVQAVLWIAALVTIGMHAKPSGGGTTWAAVVPATVILALGIAPPLVLRRYPSLLWVGALLAIAGVLLMGGVVFEIARVLG